MHYKRHHRVDAKRPDQLCSSPLPNAQSKLRLPAHSRPQTFKFSPSNEGLLSKGTSMHPTVDEGHYVAELQCKKELRTEIAENLDAALKRVGLTARAGSATPCLG
jgi:DNA polymerase III delta prime subunit